MKMCGSYKERINSEPVKNLDVMKMTGLACGIKGGSKDSVSIRWIDNFQFLGTAREHSVVVDQKEERGGSNTGFKPTELLLLSLGSCMGTTIVAKAELEGLDVSELKLDVDIEKVFEDEVKWKMNINVHIDGDISPEAKKKLVSEAEKECKISNILRSICEIQAKLK